MALTVFDQYKLVMLRIIYQLSKQQVFSDNMYSDEKVNVRRAIPALYEWTSRESAPIRPLL